MKHKYRILITILLVGLMFTSGRISGVEIPVSVNTIRGKANVMPAKYVPPMISNGSLSLQIDWTGSQRHSDYAGLFRAGRRYTNPNSRLVTFGWFEQETSVDSKPFVPETWTQSLDALKGLMTATSTGKNIKTEMTALVPLDRDQLAVSRTITSTSDKPQKVRVSFVYHLCPVRNTTDYPPYMTGEWQCDGKESTATFNYTVYGHPLSRGTILLFGSQQGKIEMKGPTATYQVELPLAPKESKEVSFHLLFDDSIDGKDWQKRVKAAQVDILKAGFENIKTKNIRAWSDYLAESLVDLPDTSLQRMYNTAQYHLRINATRWSFPVGIAPRLWNARFFGWDEMFCHQGLITANHLAIARHCPDFRKAILKVATFRVAHYGKPGKYGARYVWEALEDGTEGAPPGFWNDHIFHISNIAKSAWTQYLYSDDIQYLKDTGYPVILECARYFLSHWVYRDSNGEYYIGKCTDLERLGPAKDHPFMTTCGAIYTMRAAAEAARLLKLNLDESEEFEKTATKLVESLPQRDGAYIGYPGCQEHTIATLGGIFPYDIFDASNSLQKKAAYKFIQEGRANGNMYPVGNSICPWYAGKMAATMAILEDREEPVKLMREAAGTVGAFGELYEINEEKVSMKPWFSTAAGNCVYAINQMFLHCRENEIRLFCGVPETWRNFAFRLPAYGGIVTDVKVENGRLTRLVLTPNHTEKERQRVIVLPKTFLDGKTMKNPGVIKQEVKNDKVFLTIKVREKLDLLSAF